MTQSNKWERLQEDLLRNNALLAEITVENTTPVIFGGYNAKPYSAALGIIEDPRPTEIKGQWRWWARALVSGALYNRKILIDISEANKIIAHVLGGKIGNELKPSKVSLELRLNFEECSDIKEDIVKKIPRLRLLLRRGMSKSSKEAFIYEKIKLKIIVYKTHIGDNIPTIHYNFALISLIVSLLFSGMGAITNRAFGSLKISGINILDEEINTDIEKIKHIYVKTDIKDIKNIIENILKIALDVSDKYYEELKLNVGTRKKYILPLIPSIVQHVSHNNSDDLFNNEVFRFDIKKCKVSDQYDILEEIGKITLHSTIREKCRDLLKNSCLHMILLGLPRRGMRCLEHRTANPSIRNKRRISTIGFTVLRNDELSYVLTYGMLAYDLFDRSRVNNLWKDEEELINNFENIWNCINKNLCIQKQKEMNKGEKQQL